MPILDGISAAEQIAAKHIAPVVILTAFSQRELVERARDAGAMAYLVKPFTKADLVPAIEIAVSRFQELSALGAEVGTLRERLEVRKLLDRAKGRLQVDAGLTEPEAFRWIQKTSMDRRVPMRLVAEEVLAASSPVPRRRARRTPRTRPPPSDREGTDHRAGPSRSRRRQRQARPARKPGAAFGAVSAFPGSTRSLLGCPGLSVPP